MNLRRLSVRAAAVGATAALAAGALVGATATSASAGTAENIYTCTVPVLGAQDVTLSITGELPVHTYPAGAPVAPNLVGVTAAVGPATAALLDGANVTEVTVPDFTLKLGNVNVPLPLAGPVNADTGAWSGTGSNKAFTTPTPGSFKPVMPQKFNISLNVTGLGALAAPCVLKAGQTANAVDEVPIVLVQQGTKMKVTAPKPVKKGKVAKLSVSVKSTILTTLGAPGKVVVKEGKKVVGQAVLNKAGVANVSLGKKLKPGKHKLTVSYAGNKSWKASKATVTLTVKK